MKTICFLLFILLSVGPIGAAELKLSWTDNSANEDGFNIYRRDGQAGTFAKIGDSGVKTYIDNTVVVGNNYCYQVTAFNAAGESSPSNVACATVTEIPETSPPTSPFALKFDLHLNCTAKEIGPDEWEIKCPVPAGP